MNKLSKKRPSICPRQDPKCSQRVLDALQAMGVHTELDDFGTGYSSLTSLKNLPLNTLKVDMSLVHGIGIDLRDEALLKASIAMANALKINVIAEGVETKLQNDFLLREGCKVFQGYLHGRPMQFEKFVEMLVDDNDLDKQQPRKTRTSKIIGSNNNITLLPSARKVKEGG